ncbi:MAG: metallopeptidase family protein [Planctomycetota bacterium]|nr:MAG: metallopeptidase family protein [Planctomycetota bacterium]
MVRATRLRAHRRTRGRRARGGVAQCVAQCVAHCASLNMRRRERERFDALFDEVLALMPASIHTLIEECPLVLEDAPSAQLLAELGLSEDDEILCGLHTGIPLTERSVDRAELGNIVHIFREGVLDMAGGWDEGIDEDGTPYGGEARVREEIRITILHELGHHFGLDEDDLERLGYA